MGGEGGWCVRLTTSPPSRAECHEIWKPKPSGTLRAKPGLLRDSFTFYGLDSCDSGQGPVLGECTHCNEVRFRIKGI